MLNSLLLGETQIKEKEVISLQSYGLSVQTRGNQTSAGFANTTKMKHDKELELNGEGPKEDEKQKEVWKEMEKGCAHGV